MGNRTFTLVRFSDFSLSNKNKLEATVSEDKGNDSQKHVRRPLNGLRPNTTYYATLMSPNGLLNSSYINSKKLTNFSNNFMIQNVTITREEKMQVVETFGENYVYFFGNRQPSAQFRGLLLNSQTFEWFSEFDKNYVQSFRGTRTAARAEDVSITIDGVTYYGYIYNVSYDLNAEMPNSVGVSFSMQITKIQHLTDSTELKGKSVPISSLLNTEGPTNNILTTLILGNSANSTVTKSFSSLAEELAFYSVSRDVINYANVVENAGIQLPSTNTENTEYSSGYRGLFPDEYVNHISGKPYDDLVDEANIILDQEELAASSIKFETDIPKNLNTLILEDAKKRGMRGTLEPKVYITVKKDAQEEDVRNIASGYLDAHINDSSIFDGLNIKLKQTLTIAANLGVYKGLEAANNLFGRSTQKLMDQVNSKASTALGALK